LKYFLLSSVIRGGRKSKFIKMFSKPIKLLFVAVAYAPILLIWWIVSIYNIQKMGGHLQLINLKDFNFLDLFNTTNLLFLFFLFLILFWYIMILAKRRLTRNYIEIKSIESADSNMSILILSYFLPCIEIYSKDILFKVLWLILLFISILINYGTYYYNPLIKLFGFRYYKIVTKSDVAYLMISQKKLINKTSVNVCSKLTDYVILNSSK
jgi:hypothetical protein